MRCTVTALSLKASMETAQRPAGSVNKIIIIIIHPVRESPTEQQRLYDSLSFAMTRCLAQSCLWCFMAQMMTSDLT
ncbi:hypothetical protein AMECASPLE_024742 [Ameca splendens]|uniref:Uncharacterized protein n=1 Tax=Ameca splendens TaxID=208324 RepID=A0ABV1A2H2_9TELE